jgi:hypothetical protein
MTVLEQLFPGLRAATYAVISPRGHQYNCIAWAVGDTAKWWWPTNAPGDVPRFWPDGVPREETLAAFTLAMATLDYAPVDNESRDKENPEPGFEKLALFVDARGVPTHAARQLRVGRWTSKLGAWEDIEHDLHALEGSIYGTVAIVFRRTCRT